MRQQDPAIRDQRMIAAPSHDDLTRFELGVEEGVALGEPTLAALDPFLPQPTPVLAESLVRCHTMSVAPRLVTENGHGASRTSPRWASGVTSGRSGKRRLSQPET